DDASRIAFAQILPDERTSSALRFLHDALAYFASLGISAQRIMTDNGSAYRWRRENQQVRHHDTSQGSGLKTPRRRNRRFRGGW
ncbi:MAG: DDE-type integrase/transposase/recombinase, partial [Verrucomicrobia bacterium]|nr:DDE-type integrase/transposase/recombinase [Verrucomicrobiota bacterium]